jgi:predicted unusual protein kinase regulating ubiquinone biosynthesis (AarF/ABC1/UbiB family)
LSTNKLITSAASRLLKLGELAGRVGISMAGNTLANLFRDEENQGAHRAAVLLKNAVRIKEALGRLKGVPMKIGQMLSLHERLFPEEVARVLRMLQQKAPAAPFEDILAMIRNELGRRFKHIEYIDENALAAASIGQVHRARLKDGRDIALKVQYPGIDDVIRADMKNLKGVLKLLFSMFTRMDMEPVWQELNDRLLEELDYEKEAANMKRMARFFKNDKSVIIPKVIDKVSSRHVLGMELVLGISPDKLSLNEYPQELKNAWAVSIVRLILQGVFHFRFLHADPNIANFSFLENGGIIVYDFGCMKEVPEHLSKGYVRLINTALKKDYHLIPQELKSIGVHRADGTPISLEMVSDFAEVFYEFIEPGVVYSFGDDHRIYERLQALGFKHISESMSLVFPKDIIFIDRTFGGHFGNLCRLNATADWRSILSNHIGSAFISNYMNYNSPFENRLP